MYLRLSASTIEEVIELEPALVNVILTEEPVEEGIFDPTFDYTFQ